MTYLATILPRFVGTEDWNSRPFQVLVGGVVWSVATDRKWVVAMRGGDFEPPAGPPDKLARVGEILRAPVSSDRFAVSVAELSKWARDVVDVATEDETGIAPCSLLGVAVDAGRLVEILDGLFFQKIAVWNATGALGERAVGMTVAGGWLAYLAGLDRTSLSLPEFEIKVSKKRRKRA